jgi:4'-phosphopantetheinyl transferase EntD
VAQDLHAGEIERVLGTRRRRARAHRATRLQREATYKAVHPLVERGFGFQQVELAIDWETGRFTPRLDDTFAVGCRIAACRGRFARRGGFVFCAATLAAATA